MRLVSSSLDPIRIPKPLPDYTGADLKYKDSWHGDWSGGVIPKPHRHFTEELTLAQACQLVRNAETGKQGSLNPWRLNIFQVPSYWGVRVVHHWRSGWTMTVISNSEGCTN